MKKLLASALCVGFFWVSDSIVYVVNNFKYGDKVVFKQIETDLSVSEAEKAGVKVEPNYSYLKIDDRKIVYKKGLLFQAKISDDIIKTTYKKRKNQ